MTRGRFFARLRRVHPADRRAHRRRFRPAMARNRRNFRARSRRPHRARRSRPARPGAASRVYWPVDGGGRLPVELSGLPVYRRRAQFRRLSRLRRVPRSRQPRASRRCCAALEPAHEPAPSLSADIVPAQSEHAAAAHPPAGRRCDATATPGPPASIPMTFHHQPIWISPWKRPKTSCLCRSARSARRDRPCSRRSRTTPSTSLRGNCRRGSTRQRARPS